MVNVIISLICIIYLSHGLLAQVNRFIDNNDLQDEILEVQSIGKYYQPFRVDYLKGQSRKVDRMVRVDVLPKKAESTKIGERVEIVVGTGILGKNWVALKDKYEEFNTVMFKTVYIGIFCLLLAIITLFYFRIFAKKRIKNSLACGLYIIALAVSFILFYLI